MIRLTKKASVLIAVLTAMAAVVVVNPAADAAPRTAVSDGVFRLFQNDNYGGGYRDFTGSLTEFSGRRWNNNQSMQNSASSMQNFSDSYVGMWDIGTSCTGASYVAKPHSVDSTFGNNGFNDKASCLKFL